MGVTGVDRLELVVSSAIRSMLRLVRSVCLWFGLMGRTFDQTASIGAVTGVTLAPSGAVLPGVGVDLSKKGGGERKSATSDENGRFGFPLLPPGKYELQASKQDFEPVSLPEITIHITEILRLELHLRLAMRFERAQVSSNPRCRIPHEIEGYP